MLHVTPHDFDGDGLSEFLVELRNAGVRDTTLELKVLKLTLKDDAFVVADELSSKYQRVKFDVAIEQLPTPGHVRISIGDETSFVLVRR